MSKPAEKKRYNLRDVANLADVSVATVSRVLNDPERVAPKTRTRVEIAMQELRFVPSAAARAINSGRTRMVAALLPTLDNSIYARVVDGLESGLSGYGLSLMVAQTAGDPDIEFDRARRLVDIGAEGLILVGLTHSPRLHSLIEHLRIPALTISCFDAAASLPTIGYDNEEAAVLAARHLFELGHSEIAVVHGPCANNDRFQWRREALERLDGRHRFTLFEIDLSFAGGAAAARQLLEDQRPFTAALCFSDVIAMGVVAEAKRRDVAVPGDLSVLGMEDLPSSAAMHPPLTSVRLQVRKMAESAADALAGWVEEDIKPSSQYLESTLIARASTAPAHD